MNFPRPGTSSLPGVAKLLPPREPVRRRDWAKAQQGVVLNHSGLDETSREALPCQSR
jgi:hypothetical protein